MSLCIFTIPWVFWVFFLASFLGFFLKIKLNSYFPNFPKVFNEKKNRFQSLLFKASTLRMFCVSSPAEAAQQKPAGACQLFGYHLDINLHHCIQQKSWSTLLPLGIVLALAVGFRWTSQRPQCFPVRSGAKRTWWHRRGLWNALSRVSPTLGLHSHRKPNKNIAFKTTAFPAFSCAGKGRQERHGHRGKD